MGYQPNPLARSLAGGTTGIIAFVYPLVIPQIASLEIKIIASAANVINQAQYDFLLLTHSIEANDNLQRVVLSGMVEGVILLQVHMEDPRVKFLREVDVPFVLMGRCANNTGLYFVDMDIDYGMRVSIEHLAQLGHRKVAYFYLDEPGFGLVARALQSFQQYAQEHGVEPVVRPCRLEPESGAQAFHALLDQYPDITAAIYWTDIAAWGGIQAAKERGLQIPHDFSLITFDRSSLPAIGVLNPTSIDIRAEEMAATGAQMLVTLLDGKSLETSQLLLRPYFVGGETTAPPPARVR